MRAIVLGREGQSHDKPSRDLEVLGFVASTQPTEVKTIGYTQDYFQTFGPSGANDRTGTLDSQALSGRIDHTWKTSLANNLRWGAEVQNRQLNGLTFSTVPSRIAFNEVENRNVVNTALFAVNTWKITDRVALDVGFRQNFNSQFGSYLNPSLGSHWEISPSLALRGSISGAQRNPGLDQLYLYDTVHGWFPNPNLQPETGANWTAGLDLNLSPTAKGSITYFGSDLNNRIATQAVSPTVTQWVNIDRVATNGLELSFKQQLTPQIAATASYTYTDAKIQSGTSRGLQLALVPYSVAQVGLGYVNNGWELNLLANYNSGTRRTLFVSPGQAATDFVPALLAIPTEE
jgi:vitamin B12 transporter